MWWRPGSGISTRLLWRRALLSAALSFGMVATACGGGDADTGPTPTGTAGPGENVDAALATVPPTPFQRPGPTAGTVPATSTPARLPTSTPAGSGSATPTAAPAPSPSPTRTPSPVPTAATAMTPTPAPTPTSTAIPFQSGGVVANVTEGALPHKPGSGSAIEYKTGVDVADFRVSVSFENPFHAEFAAWNYGIKFRDNGTSYQMITLDSQARLNYLVGGTQTVDLVSSQDISSILTGGAQGNDLTLVVLGNVALIFINNSLQATIDVIGENISGDISLVTDIYNESKVMGAETTFTSFTVNRAGLAVESRGGELVKQTGGPVIGVRSLPLKETVLDITFISPYPAFSGKWSFGLVFESSESDVSTWLVFDERKKWQMIRRDETGKDSVRATADKIDEMRTGRGEENHIRIISVDGEYLMFVNGSLRLNIQFIPSDLQASVAPFAGFDDSHQKSGTATMYKDFVVWSLG